MNSNLSHPTHKVLFIKFNNNADDEIKSKYLEQVIKHNENMILYPNRHVDSGFDLFCPETVYITPHTTEKIGLNIHTSAIDVGGGPQAYYLYPRSSMGKTRFRLANKVGIIDSGYRGELCALVDNIGAGLSDISEEETKQEYYHVNDKIKKYHRLFQICMPDLKPFLVKIVDGLDETARGNGGFGSTGR